MTRGVAREPALAALPAGLIEITPGAGGRVVGERRPRRRAEHRTRPRWGVAHVIVVSSGVWVELC
jgi:hypothetical protein